MKSRFHYILEEENKKEMLEYRDILENDFNNLLKRCCDFLKKDPLTGAISASTFSIRMKDAFLEDFDRNLYE